MTAAFRVYRLEAKFESLKNLRLPIFSLSTVLFPVMFYLMFGLGIGSDGTVGPVPRALYLAVAYAAVGVIGASGTGTAFGLLLGLGLVTVACFAGPGVLYFRRP